MLWIALPPALAVDGAVGAVLRAMPAGWAAAWVVCRIVGAVVVVPVVEELAFRGYLTRRLIARDFESVPLGRLTWLSVVGSSLLFGLLHQRVVAGTAAGVLYAAALHRRGSLGDAVLAHAITNALLVVYELSTGAWGW